MTWLHASQFRPVDAPLRGTSAARSAAMLEQVLEQFDVTTAKRYQPDKVRTWCNIFVWDATRALGCEVPHWYDVQTGEGLPVGRGSEMTANRMVDYLDGGFGGWRKVTPEDAVARASFGFPVILGWYNQYSGPGHVAMLLPDGTVAQAGRKCLWRATVAKAFGRFTPRYWTHD